MCAKNQHGDDYVQTKLGSKLHRAFMAEIGEEMCQAEVAHHANKDPEYLCSRPQKYVHLYKQALAVNIRKPKPQAADAAAIGQYEWDWQEEAYAEWKMPAVSTQRSDMECMRIAHIIISGQRALAYHHTCLRRIHQRSRLQQQIYGISFVLFVSMVVASLIWSGMMTPSSDSSEIGELLRSAHGISRNNI